MQIEGTPNERALLVAFAYVAGFTAAFILFGYSVSDSSSPVTVVQTSSTGQAASVGTALGSQEAEPTEAPTSGAVSTEIADGETVLVYENNGLYLYTGAEFPTLLSKEAAAAGVSYDATDDLRDKQGFHTALPSYDYVAAFQQVFFCEQYDMTGSCTPFIYDLDEQQLHLVTVDGEPLEIDNRDAEQVVVTNAGSYVVSGYRSVSPATPWEMVAE